VLRDAWWSSFDDCRAKVTGDDIGTVAADIVAQQGPRVAVQPSTLELERQSPDKSDQCRKERHRDDDREQSAPQAICEDWPAKQDD
jgi:hypothetical protein